mmetsp:Transcript_14906/g.58432  ORF Transcript_14906/g.58432 Transcript_14906/m.58432 type:complete len:304 (-) Transcript_14906:816-1727(-)
MRSIAPLSAVSAASSSTRRSWKLARKSKSTNGHEGYGRQGRTLEGCFGLALPTPRSGQASSIRVVHPSSDGYTDYYGILGVSPSADTREIKSAFRRAALKYHPDVNQAVDAPERFNEIKMAYQILSDPDRRSKLDSSRAKRVAVSNDSGASSSSPSGSPPPTPQGETPKGTFEGTLEGGKERLYGFDEFLCDVQEEFDAFERSRSRVKHRTLWEELSGIGEEFVEFLEDAVQDTVPGKKEGPFDRFWEDIEREPKYSANTSANKRPHENHNVESSMCCKMEPGQQGETVDKMLEQLKRDMGLT